MRDPKISGWSHDTCVSPESLNSVRELNHRFLNLLGRSADEWAAAQQMVSSADVLAWIVRLSEPQKKAAANCPYALFDLRFEDHAYWHMRREVKLHGGGGSGAADWRVADESHADEKTLDFVRAALFFAWHLAATDKVAPRLLLGMNVETATVFRSLTIGCVPTLAAAVSMHLSARWNDCRSYWNALTYAAARPNAAALRRVQLYGLQLAAAARIPQDPR